MYFRYSWWMTHKEAYPVTSFVSVPQVHSQMSFQHGPPRMAFGTPAAIPRNCSPLYNRILTGKKRNHKGLVMNSLLSQYQAKRPWILRVSGCSRFSVRNPPYIHHVFWFTNHPPAIGVAQNPPVASNKSKSMFSILSRQGTSTTYHFISYHNRNIYVYIYI